MHPLLTTRVSLAAWIPHCLVVQADSLGPIGVRWIFNLGERRITEASRDISQCSHCHSPAPKSKFHPIILPINSSLSQVAHVQQFSLHKLTLTMTLDFHPADLQRNTGRSRGGLQKIQEVKAEVLSSLRAMKHWKT